MCGWRDLGKGSEMWNEEMELSFTMWYEMYHPPQNLECFWSEYFLFQMW